MRAILAAIETLTEAPCRYRTDDHPGMRRMVIERHVIIYRVDRGTGDSATAGEVQVLRVFSPGQQQEP